MSALRLACSPVYARPLFWQEDGDRVGYEPDVAHAVAARLGRSVEWDYRAWADMRPALLAGEADAIWCGFAITPERLEVVAATRPYASFDESALVAAGDQASAPVDLAGRRVAAIAGSTNEALAQGWPGVEVLPFVGTTDDVLAEMLAALEAGDVSAVVDDTPAFVEVDPARWRIAFTIPTGNRWGAALRKGDPLVVELDAALGEVLADGTLQGIWERWFPTLAFPAGALAG